jgi:hypothetical protein
MLGVSARRALPIPDQLLLRPFPGLGIDERRAPDGNPFGLGPPRAALTIARAPIFQAPPPIRADLPGLRAIVGRFAFIAGVAEDLDDTPLRPPAVLRLPGDDTVEGKTPLHGIRTALFLHTPARDLPDHLSSTKTT